MASPCRKKLFPVKKVDVADDSPSPVDDSDFHPGLSSSLSDDDMETIEPQRLYGRTRRARQIVAKVMLERVDNSLEKKSIEQESEEEMEEAAGQEVSERKEDKMVVDDDGLMVDAGQSDGLEGDAEESAAEEVQRQTPRPKRKAKYCRVVNTDYEQAELKILKPGSSATELKISEEEEGGDAELVRESGSVEAGLSMSEDEKWEKDSDDSISDADYEPEDSESDASESSDSQLRKIVKIKRRKMAFSDAVSPPGVGFIENRRKMMNQQFLEAQEITERDPYDFQCENLEEKKCFKNMLGLYYLQSVNGGGKREVDAEKQKSILQGIVSICEFEELKAFNLDTCREKHIKFLEESKCKPSTFISHNCALVAFIKFLTVRHAAECSFQFQPSKIRIKQWNECYRRRVQEQRHEIRERDRRNAIRTEDVNKVLNSRYVTRCIRDTQLMVEHPGLSRMRVYGVVLFTILAFENAQRPSAADLMEWPRETPTWQVSRRSTREQQTNCVNWNKVLNKKLQKEKKTPTTFISHSNAMTNFLNFAIPRKLPLSFNVGGALLNLKNRRASYRKFLKKRLVIFR
ncbi:unnamed protein product [Clavelina lepadiformis]|uniref:Uncharacterized protein n=1 Tax=Clavelina lepadiformis TaxID=159417 RepID=A0ABP0FU73_CLALP